MCLVLLVRQIHKVCISCMHLITLIKYVPFIFLVNIYNVRAFLDHSVRDAGYWTIKIITTLHYICRWTQRKASTNCCALSGNKWNVSKHYVQHHDRILFVSYFSFKKRGGDRFTKPRRLSHFIKRTIITFIVYEI